MTGSAQIGLTLQCNETEINTPPESKFLLIRMVLLFFQLDFPVQSYELLNANNTHVDFDRARYL